MTFFKSIKFRLTIWYLVAILVLMPIFGAVAYFMLSNNLYNTLDTNLSEETTELVRSMTVSPDNSLRFLQSPVELVLIYDADGTLRQKLGPSLEFSTIDPLVKRALFGQSSFLTVRSSDEQTVRLYAAPATVNSNTRLAIVVGRPATDIQELLGTFRSILGAAGLAVVVLAAAGGLFLANRALKPVDRITQTAQHIGEGHLNRRIDIHSDDELGRLASTLNGMLSRLENAIDRQRQFTADASHELRTPLAVIQAESTLTLEKERDPLEYRKSLEMVSQEVNYMTSVITKLLFLARSDAGQEPVNFQEVNLNDLITELSQDAEALARDKGIQFERGQSVDLSINGDRVKLKQLFLNLLENAIRYTPEGGHVSVTMSMKDNNAVVAVQDTGVGIPAEHLEHIFERFYRVDKARSRAEGGSGLGLAISKHIAEIHGGKIVVESEVDKGSTFRVILPLLNEHATES